MKDDYTTNSHYFTFSFLFWKVAGMYSLNLGVMRSRNLNFIAEQGHIQVLDSVRDAMH